MWQKEAKSSIYFQEKKQQKWLRLPRFEGRLLRKMNDLLLFGWHLIGKMYFAFFFSLYKAAVFAGWRKVRSFLSDLDPGAGRWGVRQPLTPHPQNRDNLGSYYAFFCLVVGPKNCCGPSIYFTWKELYIIFSCHNSLSAPDRQPLYFHLIYFISQWPEAALSTMNWNGSKWLFHIWPNCRIYYTLFK